MTSRYKLTIDYASQSMSWCSCCYLHHCCLAVKETDRFSLVSYSSDVTVDIPLTYMTKKNKESAKAAVKALRATGSTALCDGLVNGTCVHHTANLL